MRRMRDTVTARAVLVTCAVALISGAATAAAAVPVIVSTTERQYRESLVNEADLTSRLLRPRLQSRSPADELAAVAGLRQRGITMYLIRDGAADRPGLPQNIVDRVARGQRVSSRTAPVDGRPSLVEGRPLQDGNGIVLVRPATTGVTRKVLAQMWLPLLAGLAAGVLAGFLLARRLVRPLRVTAAAAARLSAGDREVRLPVTRPVEIAELAEAMNALATALTVSEGRQREFLTSISHELRTPLTTIKGYAEALADGVVSADGAPRAGATLLAEAERLDRLVTDLLALARLEADDFPLELMPVELSDLVAAAAQTWAQRSTAAGVTLSTVLEPCLVRSDPGRLRQVIDGLVENALRILPAGAPLVLATGADGSIEVRDGGPGLAPEDLAVAFDRGALHERYREVRKVGTGLGLALAARLVRRLGGTIEAGHAPEGGARFTVRLPLQ